MPRVVSSTLCGDTSRWTTGSDRPSGPSRSCAAARPRKNPDADRGDELPPRRLVALRVPADPRAEIDAVDPLEHHVVVAVVVDEVVDLGDVRRLQHRADARLFDEHRDVRALDCEILVHLLHRDISDESRVTADAAAPDIRHAAATSNFDELVAPADDHPGTGLLGHLILILAQTARRGDVVGMLISVHGVQPGPRPVC